jgi:N-acetylmuramoyl-L-alanine amidase
MASTVLAGLAQTPASWPAAVRARQAFDAQPAGSHSRADYARVMDGFRAIYHSDPGDRHASEAIANVADLLAEEGRELADRREFAEAAGQYEYLAKVYPGGAMAAMALGKAVELYGPEGAGDPGQAERVRSELLNDYPRSAEARSLRLGEQGGPAAAAVVATPAPEVVASVRNEAGDGGLALPSNASMGSTAPIVRARSGQTPALTHTAATNATATLTSIRHWSTSDYTRVAIDLGEDVQYEAARVENPDRIFFDLHHTQLAPGLAGKTFQVTDDGFLTRIRASRGYR